MDRVILYIHGKGGSFKEVEVYKENCQGLKLIGLDYEIDYPWIVREKIKAAYDQLKREYGKVYVLATSIGAYFSMLALQNSAVEKAFFISPIVDMEQVIRNMMLCAGVTEDKLQKELEIPTSFGETLSWEYLSYVRNNPIKWKANTEVLYGARDNLTSQETIETFVGEHKVKLTVMEEGEHWFHTKEQIEFLNSWMKKVVQS